MNKQETYIYFSIIIILYLNNKNKTLGSYGFRRIQHQVGTNFKRFKLGFNVSTIARTCSELPVYEPYIVRSKY